MLNKELNPDNKIEIKDSFKTYSFDQDKNIHPTKTIEMVISRIKSYFPKDKMMFKLISPSNYPITAYRFINSYYSSNGKGVCLEQAKASAIMEFIERYCWIYFDYLNYPGFQNTTYNELSKSFNMINNKYFSCSVEELTPDILEELMYQIPMSWIPAYSLISERTVYYPINWHNITSSSNGLCSGNSNEEAIYQGLCELIERHNFDYFMETKTPISKIYLNTIDNTIVKDILKQCIEDNIDLNCFDITYKLGVPTFAVCGKDLSTSYICLKEGWGLGTHTSPIKALYRAITEYFMGRFMVLQNLEGAEKDYLKLRNENLGFNITLPLEEINTLKESNLETVNDISDNNIKVEINRIIDIFKIYNLDLLVVDKRNKDLDVPVFRVISDGLTHKKLKIKATNSIHFNLAQMYVEAGNRKKAEENFSTAFLNASSLSSYFNVGIKPGSMDFLFKKDYIEAINVLFLQKKNNSAQKRT